MKPESELSPQEFEDRLYLVLTRAAKDCIDDMKKDPDSTPERMAILNRVLKTIGASRKLGNIVLRAYQHVSHGGPSRKEVETVLKEAGLL